MPRLLILTHGPDSAGCGMALKTAFDHCAPDWEVRMVRRRNTWFDYPGDITWGYRDRRNGALVTKLFRRAHVIHVMQDPQILRAFRWQGKPIVVQQIGSYYRDNPQGVSEAVRAVGGHEAVNSLELLNIAPNATFLPWTLDLDMIAGLRRDLWQPSDRTRIYHSPSNRAIKSTAAFIEATRRLAKRHPIDVQIVERTPWMENLRRKAQADIVFDEVTLGYGLNSAEAWAMGMPALVGLVDPEARQLFLDHHGEFPYPDTTEDTIEQRLEELIVSPEARAHWGEVGRKFVYQNHAEDVVVRQAIALYERVMG